MFAAYIRAGVIVMSEIDKRCDKKMLISKDIKDVV
jgi:hypothetical protein